MKSKRTKAELFKIIAEIVAGIVLVTLLGFLTDRILTEFFPKYKVYEPLINESVRSIIVVVIGFMVTSTIIKYIESKIGADGTIPEQEVITRKLVDDPDKFFEKNGNKTIECLFWAETAYLAAASKLRV